MLERFTVKKLHTIDDDLREELETALDVANSRAMPEFFDAFRGGASDRQALDTYVFDADENLIAGLVAVTYWKTLYIDMLWVADTMQKQGIGAALMAQTENEARLRGAAFAWLRTFTASDFYLKLGYEVFGALDNHPPGYTYSFMRKTL
jgi:GNAT superfamily N-acetyltransferase